MRTIKIVEILCRTSTLKFIPEIDALRFLAIIPVLFAHFSQAFLEYNTNFDRELIESKSLLREILYNGNIGVYLFFGVSGFILTLPFINLHWSQLKFKKYFFRRLVRIEPPYLIALTIFMIVHIFLGDKDLTFLWERFVSSLFYSHNIAHQSYSYILPPAWSLEIEIQFYLLVPVLLCALLAFDSRYWKYIVYAAFFMFSMKVDLSPNLELGDFMIYFMSGIFAAEVYKNGKLRKHYVWDIVFICSFFLFFYYLDNWYLISLSLFLIIISSFNLVLLRRILINKWVTIIGGMCYSIYLLHFPFYHLVMKLFSDRLTLFSSYEVNFAFQALLFIPLSIIACAFYFLLIEKPFMVLSQRLSKKK